MHGKHHVSQPALLISHDIVSESTKNHIFSFSKQFSTIPDIKSIYPLFAATGIVVSMSVFQLFRNLVTNPDVRVAKENCIAGILENYEEGKIYTEHGLRKYVRNRAAQIMPSINDFFVQTED